MAWYRVGTATFTNGSRNVTGAGTAWSTNVRSGDEIIGPDNISREVETVTSDTALTMVETYAGTTAAGAAYKVKPIQGWNRDVAAQLAALINDYGSIEAALTVLSGNVGIGTASPASKLHVAGDVRVDGRVIQQRAAGSAYLATMGFSDTLGGSKTDNLSIGNDGGGALLLHTNSAERLRIDSLGNVGIGVSPTAKLHIASGTNKWLRLESSAVSASFMQLDAGAGGGVLGYIGSNGGGALSGGAGADLAVRAEQSLLLASGGNVERMRIDGAGNVGIGTEAPAARLHVVGTVRLDVAAVPSAVAGVGSPLPSTPEGYMTINLFGNDRLIPYYRAS